MTDAHKTTDDGEVTIPLLEIRPPSYEDSDVSEVRESSPRPVRHVTVVVAACAALIIAWLPFTGTFLLYRYMYRWSPVAFSIGPVIAFAVLLYTVGLLSFLVLVKLHSCLLARRYTTPKVLPVLVTISILAVSVGVPLLFAFAVIQCKGSELAVIVHRTGAPDLRATVLFPNTSSVFSNAHEIVLRRGNDSGTAALLGVAHAADGYAITYDFASHTARASDGASAVFRARNSDPGMEISFPGGTYTITLDAVYRDSSVYGDGEYVLRLVDQSRVLALDAYCVTRFDLSDNDLRARARVLFPLGLIMYNYASKDAY